MNKEDERKDEKTSSEEEEESSEEEEDLGLEGVLVRNPDVSSSSDDDDDSDEDKEEKDDTRSSSRPKKKKRKKQSSEPEEIQVEFTFCDMDEKYFDGLKNLLHNSSTVYQTHSSALVDVMIENISVGTVISTEGDEEGNVFGFASVLNVTTYQSSPAIQYLKEICLKGCPKEHRKELEVVLSGKTKRPAGFLLHGRMINLPIEITEVLHQQLVKDIEWAVKNAEGGEEERKSLDFGAFVLLAPCQKEGGSIIYRYFEDEIFAGRAEFRYIVDAPKSYSKEDKQLLDIIVMTKTGHREAMEDLGKMVGGSK